MGSRVRRKIVRAHKCARTENLHAIARDAGLSPSAGASLLKRSAGARRVVSMLVPLSEGSARAEQWEPSSVTSAVRPSEEWFRRLRRQQVDPCSLPGVPRPIASKETCRRWARAQRRVRLRAGFLCARVLCARTTFPLRTRPHPTPPRGRKVLRTTVWFTYITLDY